MSEVLRPSAEAALIEWGARVRANREQVDRFREVPDAADFYGSVASMFRADPRRSDEPVLELLRRIAMPGETWLDVGAGAGRYALPLALEVGEVIALDASDGMLQALRESMTEYGIANLRTVHDRWPTATPIEADVSMICHVGYDVEAIGSFLGALEAAARRLCVAVLFERRPTTPYDALWPEIHGEARATLPALREFLVLLLARGHTFELRLADRPPMSYDSPETALNFARRQTWVQPGGKKDQLLQRLIGERLVEREGRYSFDWGPGQVGVVTWRPRADGI